MDGGAPPCGEVWEKVHTRPPWGRERLRSRSRHSGARERESVQDVCRDVPLARTRRDNVTKLQSKKEKKNGSRAENGTFIKSMNLPANRPNRSGTCRQARPRPAAATKCRPPTASTTPT